MRLQIDVFGQEHRDWVPLMGNASFPSGRFYLPVLHLDPVHPSKQAQLLFSTHVPIQHSGVQTSVSKVEKLIMIYTIVIGGR